MKRVFITGVSGYFGSKLVEHLGSIMNNLMWMLRVKFITEFPSPGLNMTVYPWIASNGKLKRETGYTFNYTTREAFEDFARHVRENKASMISRIFSAFAK